MQHRDAMINAKSDLDEFCDMDTCDNAKLSFKNIKKYRFHENSWNSWYFSTCEPEIKISEEYIENNCKKIDVSDVSQSGGDLCNVEKMMVQANKMWVESSIRYGPGRYFWRISRYIPYQWYGIIFQIWKYF